MKTLDTIAKEAEQELERDGRYIQAGLVSYLACFTKGLSKKEVNFLIGAFMAGSLHTHNAMTEVARQPGSTEAECVARLDRISEELNAYITAAVADFKTRGNA